MLKMYLGEGVSLDNGLDGSLIITTDWGTSSIETQIAPQLFPDLIRFVEELQQELKESHE